MDASRAEIKIREILEEAGLNFKMEYIFPDLKTHNGRPLRFDFVIFDDDNNIDFLIEYQQQYNDNQKRRFCALHNLHLIEIPYTEENLISYDYIMRKAGY